MTNYEAQATATIRCIDEILETLPKIKKVVEKFDGKVYNKRLQTALREATGKYIVTERKYGIDISMLTDSRSYSYMNERGARDHLYAQHYGSMDIRVYMTSEQIADMTRQGSTNLEIRASFWNEKIDQYAADARHYKAQMQKVIIDMPEIQARAKELQDQIDQFKKDVPAVIRDMMYLRF